MKISRNNKLMSVTHQQKKIFYSKHFTIELEYWTPDLIKGKFIPIIPGSTHEFIGLLDISSEFEGILTFFIEWKEEYTTPSTCFTTFTGRIKFAGCQMETLSINWLLIDDESRSNFAGSIDLKSVEPKFKPSGVIHNINQDAIPYPTTMFKHNLQSKVRPLRSLC